MNIGKLIVSLFFVALLGACGGGDGTDTSGRLDAPTTHGAVTSVAGVGSMGYQDGKISKINAASAVAVDSSGNVYIADTGNHRIRKLATDGTVSTLAGSGTVGSLDGSGTSAQFFSPRGIAVDAGGNVYVADSGNNSIRKISPGGNVTTLAGTGVMGSADNGTPLLATFNDPRGIAVDSSGSMVYVADFGNHIIRKYTSAGVVTVAGSAGVSGSVNGVGGAARFLKPWGLALSSSGYLYVADCGDFWGSNHLIRKINITNGAVSTVAGQAGVPGKVDGSLANATFNGPSGVAVTSDETVYVADTDNHLIRKITSAGEVSTLAGSGVLGADDGTGTAASFNKPTGIAVDSHGDIYVADTGNHLIRKIKK